MGFGKIYLKGGSEKVVIPNIRTYLVQGFQAPNWLDLRIGWFLSITDKTNDDLITGLPETIGVTPRSPLDFTDRYAIGLTNKVGRQTFLGYTNNGPLRGLPGRSIGNSEILSSDAGIGTSNTNFWRVKNGLSNLFNVQIIDSGRVRTGNSAVLQQHFPQSVAGAGGWAVLSMIRFTRSTARSKVITMMIKQGTNTSDILFSSTPTLDILQTNLAAFPTGVQQIGPVELSAVPDAFYYQWPFVNSRLRIHAAGFLMRTSI